MDESSHFQNVHPLQQWKWVIVALLVLLVWHVETYYRGGLWRVPGPFVRTISTIPRILSVYSGASEVDDLQLHRKYGPIVRTAPNQLSISDPNEIKQIYGTGTKFIKSKFYALSEAYDEEGLLPDTFILRDMAKHSYMKRNASNAYALHGLIHMEPFLEPVTAQFLEILSGYAKDKQVAPLGDLFKNYTMDGVVSLTFGWNFDFLRQGDRFRAGTLFYRVASYMAIFGQVPWLHNFLLARPFICGLVLPSRTTESMMRIVTEQVSGGREKRNDGDKMTFIDRLYANQNAHPEQINDREIMTHAFGNVTAGSDTTAIALQSSTFNLLNNPLAYRALRAEVRSAFSLGETVTFTKANTLPYLGAVIKEGIRIHPSVGMMLARTVPAGGKEICGHYIPAGIEVGINPWVLHRDPNVFTEPERFYPERWLDSVSDVEQLKMMNRCFFAFGHGAHTCSGRWISLMEITKLIPTILLNFDLSLVDAGRSYSTINRWFTFQNGINVMLTAREEEKT